MNNNCEMIEHNLCLGCTGLGEENWQGKYKCEYYQKLKQTEEYKTLMRKRGNKNVYSRINYRSNNRNIINGNITNG